MKITKTKDRNYTYYFYDGVKKYEHYKGNTGFESWREYDTNGKEIHYKDNEGLESWSDDNPDNPKNKKEEVKEKDIKPFEFGK